MNCHSSVSRLLQRAATIRIRTAAPLLQQQQQQQQQRLCSPLLQSTTRATFSTGDGSSSSSNTPATTTPPPPTAPNTEPSLLDAFRDPLSNEERLKNPPGRSWHARELRRKSFDDLHKLWIVLYKERNMLRTEQQLSRRHRLNFPHPERLKKVQKSMGAIKQVLGERKREKIAQVSLRQMEEAEGGGGYNDDEDMNEDDREQETVQATKEKV